MKRTSSVPLAWLAGLALIVCSCHDEAPRQSGELEVYVYYGDSGVANIPLQIVETGDQQNTDERGIAVFQLPAGDYVLRAEVNGPGPPHPLDYSVHVRTGEKTRFEIVDCLPCVSR